MLKQAIASIRHASSGDIAREGGTRLPRTLARGPCGQCVIGVGEGMLRRERGVVGEGKERGSRESGSGRRESLLGGARWEDGRRDGTGGGL